MNRDLRVLLGLGLALLLSWSAPVAAKAQQGVPEISLVDSVSVRIGSVETEGAPETSFANIAGAVSLPSGEIVVADGGNLDVRWFNASGEHIRTVGREGEGPGEFRFIHWIGSCPGGELLVLDPIGGRATFLSPTDGDVVLTVTLPRGLGFNQPLGCQDSSKLLVLKDRLNERIDPDWKGRVTRVSAEVVSFDLSTGAEDTLQRFPGSDFYTATEVSVFTILPLGGRALGAVGGAQLYVAQSVEDVIRVMDTDSGAWSTFEHGFPRPRLTRDAWERAVAQFVWRQPLERTRRVLTEAFDEAPPLPERQPAFLAMKADAAGRLWLQLPSSSEVVRWRVLDEEGESVATILLPSNVEPLDIGERKMVALERGPLDVPLIQVYRLPHILQSNVAR